MDEHSQPLFFQAVTYVKKKQYARSLPLFQALYKNFYFDEKVLLYYGYTLCQLDDYEAGLKIFLQLKNCDYPDDRVNLLRAYCYAKMGFVEKALEYWLKMNGDNPKNVTVRTILQHLRKSKDNETFRQYLTFKGAFGDLPDIRIRERQGMRELATEGVLIGGERIRFSRKLPFILGGVVLLILAAFVVIQLLPVSDKPLPLPQNVNNTVENSSSMQNPAVDKPILYTYATEKEVEKDYNKLKAFLVKRDYNNAHIVSNRIQNSNAPETWKKKASIDSSILPEPFYNMLKLNPVYDEVVKNPLLYKDLFVQWKGVINALTDDLHFRLMVYSKSPIYIDGFAICVLPKPYPLMEKQQVEIFGKITDFDADARFPVILIQTIRSLYEK